MGRKYQRGKYKFLDEIMPDYLNKIITRAEILGKYSLTKIELRDYLRRENIKIWDYEKKKTDKIAFNNDASLLIKGKLTIDDLCKKYDLSVGTVKNKLKELGITLVNKKPTKKIAERKYFNWKELKNNIMCSYNI